jgi:hypothetical protein
LTNCGGASPCNTSTFRAYRFLRWPGCWAMREPPRSIMPSGAGRAFRPRRRASKDRIQRQRDPLHPRNRMAPELERALINKILPSWSLRRSRRAVVAFRSATFSGPAADSVRARQESRRTPFLWRKPAVRTSWFGPKRQLISTSSAEGARR